MTQHSRKGPASAGPFRVLAVVLMVLTSACAVGRGDKDGADDGALPANLAEPAQPLDPSPTDTTVATAPDGRSVSTTPGGGPGTTATTARSGGGGAGGAPATTTVPYVSRFDLADPTGDAGIQAKPYGDATRVRIEDDGTRGRFTVELAAAIPAPLGPDEQLRVAVDLDHGGNDESEFQLFAQGNSDGWRAWLYEAEAAVEYQGTFQLGGNRLVFTVPWSALGGRKGGKLDAFVEWDGPGTVIAETSREYIPDRGQASYQL